MCGHVLSEERDKKDQHHSRKSRSSVELCLLHLSQCSKLLADISVIQFYPSKFVLITDILDNFGELSCRLVLVVRTELAIRYKW